MPTPLERHLALTPDRASAYEELFGCEPSSIFSPEILFKKPDEKFIIDVYVYGVKYSKGDFEIAVTNGMSDYPMVDPSMPGKGIRRELIQYLPFCSREHAIRLHDMAWVPLFDGFAIDTLHSLSWSRPAIAGTPWNNAFFLQPIIKSHRAFTHMIDAEPMSLLWHIPISDEERAYKRAKGPNALIDRMQEANLPWIFDETNRPSVL